MKTTHLALGAMLLAAAIVPAAHAETVTACTPVPVPAVPPVVPASGPVCAQASADPDCEASADGNGIRAGCS